MEKKIETKLQTRFSVFGKTREDGIARHGGHDGQNGSCAHATPPPLFQSRILAEFSGFQARVFLLVFVFVAGASLLSPWAAAQPDPRSWTGTGFIETYDVTTQSLIATRTQQSVTVQTGTNARNWQIDAMLACTWTVVEPTTKTGTSLPAGCTTLADRPAGTPRRSLTVNITPTQAMIDNGGVVIAMAWGRSQNPQQYNFYYAEWIPVANPIVVSPSGGLSLVEDDETGEASGIYTVRLSVLQPTADVTIRVASNNAGVAVKAGSNPAGASQELTFTSTTWNTAQTVTVEAISDDNSLDERATLSHEVLSGSASEYSWIVGDEAVKLNVNVMDDDYPGLMITGATASESDETLDFTVRLSTTSSRRVTVPWTVIAAGPDAGTATPGTAGTGDYDHSSARSGTLVFYEGSPLTRVISVPINNDSLSEGDETVKVALGAPSPSEVRISGSGVATGTIVDDDERTAVGATSGEFSQGDTTVTVDSTLPEDTGLEVVLPSELESGGDTIEELVVTLREAAEDVEIDAGLFGYTGDAADHVLVDVDVSPVPDAAVRICLPITDGLRQEAGERRLYLIRFSGGTWERLSSTVEGEMVCAETSGFSPFAVVYDLMTNMGSGNGSSGSGGGCAISGENLFASPAAWFSSPVLPAMLLGTLLFLRRFRKREINFPPL